MRKLVASLLVLSSISAFGSSLDFSSCIGWQDHVKGVKLSLNKIATDTMMDFVVGELGGCPRQLIFSDIVYQLGSTTQYACSYSAVDKDVGYPTMSCFKQ